MQQNHAKTTNTAQHRAHGIHFTTTMFANEWGAFHGCLGETDRMNCGSVDLWEQATERAIKWLCLIYILFYFFEGGTQKHIPAACSSYFSLGQVTSLSGQHPPKDRHVPREIQQIYLLFSAVGCGPKGKSPIRAVNKMSSTPNHHRAKATTMTSSWTAVPDFPVEFWVLSFTKTIDTIWYWDIFSEIPWPLVQRRCVRVGPKMPATGPVHQKEIKFTGPIFFYRQIIMINQPWIGRIFLVAFRGNQKLSL